MEPNYSIGTIDNCQEFDSADAKAASDTLNVYHTTKQENGHLLSHEIMGRAYGRTRRDTIVDIMQHEYELIKSSPPPQGHLEL